MALFLFIACCIILVSSPYNILTAFPYSDAVMNHQKARPTRKFQEVKHAFYLFQLPLSIIYFFIPHLWLYYTFIPCYISSFLKTNYVLFLPVHVFVIIKITCRAASTAVVEKSKKDFVSLTKRNNNKV